MKLSGRAIKALKTGVRKWKRLAEGKPASSHCSLCRLYSWNRTSEFMCTSCPVARHTGSPNCEGTPYYDACDLIGITDAGEYVAETPMARKACRKEYEFLKSLLPAKERKGL